MDARARFYLEGELALVVPSLLAILPPYSAPRLVASASSTFSLKISSNSRAHLKELRIKLLLLTNFELNSSNNESKSLRITQSFSNTHVMSHITTYKLCLNKPKSFCCNCVLSLTTELNFFTPQICSLKQIYSQKNCTIVVSRLKFMNLSASFTDHHHHHHLQYTIYTQF
jgi:hypothetical protein